MQLNILFFFVLFFLTTNCITTFKKERFRDKIQYNSPRMESVLVIISSNSGNWDTASGKARDISEINKTDHEQIKSLFKQRLIDCRCFLKLTVVSDEDKIDSYSDRYNYKIEITRNVSMNVKNVITNIFISSFSFFLIPTWNSIKYETNYIVKEQSGKVLGEFNYDNSSTIYKHLFLVFLMPFRELHFDDQDISDKALYDIYSKKLIPLAK